MRKGNRQRGWIRGMQTEREVERMWKRDSADGRIKGKGTGEGRDEQGRSTQWEAELRDKRE